MAISFPTDTKEIIDAIRLAIGRPVTFNIEHKLDCPTCTVDPVTNLSTDSFCTTCGGKGWLVTVSGTTISGHVTWGPSEALFWNTGGQWDQFDCRVQIEYTTANVYVVDNTKSLVVDGKTMKIDKKMYRGVPQLNRILLDLKEK